MNAATQEDKQVEEAKIERKHKRLETVSDNNYYQAAGHAAAAVSAAIAVAVLL